MGFALAMDNDVCTRAPTAEAEARIASAQVSDLAFIVRRISKTALSDDEVLFLATVLNEALQNSREISKQLMVEMMVDKGRSRIKAEALSDAIFK
jgi:hypothetical protein